MRFAVPLLTLALAACASSEEATDADGLQVVGGPPPAAAAPEAPPAARSCAGAPLTHAELFARSPAASAGEVQLTGTLRTRREMCSASGCTRDDQTIEEERTTLVLRPGGAGRPWRGAIENARRDALVVDVAADGKLGGTLLAKGTAAAKPLVGAATAECVAFEATYEGAGDSGKTSRLHIAFDADTPPRAARAGAATEPPPPSPCEADPAVDLWTLPLPFRTESFGVVEQLRACGENTGCTAWTSRELYGRRDPQANARVLAEGQRSRFMVMLKLLGEEGVSAVVTSTPAGQARVTGALLGREGEVALKLTASHVVLHDLAPHQGPDGSVTRRHVCIRYR